MGFECNGTGLDRMYACMGYVHEVDGCVGRIGCMACEAEVWDVWVVCMLHASMLHASCGLAWPLKFRGFHTLRTNSPNTWGSTDLHLHTEGHVWVSHGAQKNICSGVWEKEPRQQTGNLGE